MAPLNSVMKWEEIRSDTSLKVLCNQLFT